MASLIAKWLVVAFISLGALASIALVGKPRNPTTPKMAVGVTIANVVLLATIIVFWRT